MKASSWWISAKASMWAIRLSPGELLLEDPSHVSQLATAQAGGQWPRSS